MTYTRRKVEATEVAGLKAEHLEALTAPLDAYWQEALIGFADHYELEIDGVSSGFYCLNPDNHLMAFYLREPALAHGRDALDHVIEAHGVPLAMAGTNDPFFLSLSLDVARKCEVHTLLFEDHRDPARPLTQLRDLSFEPAGDQDFDLIWRHYAASSGSMDMDSVEAGFEGLKGYVRSVLDEHHIFLLRRGQELLATSECRISATQRPYADVGMVVAATHRRQGLGGYMLARTKQFCYERKVEPICSCEASNIGSRKAIANAGFVSRHRIVKLTF